MGSKMKKKGNRKTTSGLITAIFSWSITDILNKGFFKNKVGIIPETFSSANQYYETFTNALLEETRADIRAKMKNLFHAPSSEIFSVSGIAKQYNLSLKEGAYKPAFGDLIAITDVKPRYVEDLYNRDNRPCILGLVEVQHGDFYMKIVSSQTISFRRKDNDNRLFAVFLTNMVTNMRIWTALHPNVNRGNMKLITSVIVSKQANEQQCNICDKSESKEVVGSCSGLDNSQESAVLNCVAITKCHHQNMVKLIWGPPGTGKTETVASLLFSLLTVKHRTLTCAPTNVAVIGVAKRLIGLLDGTLKHNTYGMGDIVLFGNGERMNIDDHVELSDVFLDNRVDILASCFAMWKSCLEGMICLLEDSKAQFLQGEENRKDSNLEQDRENENKQAEVKENVYSLRKFEQYFVEMFGKIKEELTDCITSLYTHMPTSCLPPEGLSKMIKVLELTQSFQTLLNRYDVSKRGQIQSTELHRMKLQCLEALSGLRNYELPFPKKQIRSFCLKNACLILCTVSSSAKLQVEGMSPIEVVIIDEAAQLKECESCIPLQLNGVRHAILVGDEKQLPAMVQSKICEEAGFGRSLFERLARLEHRKHLLNVQRRMHPEICSFPNREFYDEKIRNGPNVIESSYEQRFLEGDMFGSYSFIDITDGKEEFDDRHSRKNMVEVAVIAEILSKLYQESLLTKQKVRIGCISPYKGQVFAIQERLGNTYSINAEDNFSVNIQSVDGFQGGEEDVIIISTVRRNDKGNVGFLSTLQRVNVALTRARYSLWILGNSETMLKSRSVWRKLVLDAKKRDCFYDANEDESLTKVIDKALIELEHLSKLFQTDSVLFKRSKWKIFFSEQFQSSMIKSEHHARIKETVANLLLKLSNGWRQQLEDESLGKMEGVSSLLMECYDVKENHKLIWTIEIRRENSTDIQVIKVWEILTKKKVRKLAKKLDTLFDEYTGDYMEHCLSKRIVGDLTLPMTWLVDEKAERANANENTVHEKQRHWVTVFHTRSVLFRTSEWKIYFSEQFRKSMIRLQHHSGIVGNVAALVVRLSNGWRKKQLKDESLCKMEGASSRLCEIYDVKEPHKLIWTVEILREDSTDIQVIKVWDILPIGKKIQKLASKLDALIGTYTTECLERCMLKLNVRDLTLPLTWTVYENTDTDTSHKLGHWNPLFHMDSVLFRTSEWKVYFSVEFHESMIRLQHHSEITKMVSDLLVKLSNGWRESHKDRKLGKIEGVSAPLLEIYDVKEPHKLIWTIEILREDSTDIQVIKVWDILPVHEIQELAKKLDIEIENYTTVCMTRCLSKWIVQELTLPMTWPVNEKSEAALSSMDTVNELAHKLDAINLKDAPGTSGKRKNRKKYSGTNVWRIRKN